MNGEQGDLIQMSYAQLIAAKARRAPEKRYVATLGMDLYFRHLSGMESDTLQIESVDTETGKIAMANLKGYRGKVVALCLVDETGNQVVTAEEACAWDNDVLEEVNGICNELNKLTKKAADEVAKD